MAGNLNFEGTWVVAGSATPKRGEDFLKGYERL